MKDARGHGSNGNGGAHGAGIEMGVPSTKHWGIFTPDGPQGRMVFVSPKVKAYSGPHQTVDQIYRQSVGR